ncbi:QacE family quaternary ammonium compound efflux SMR transporter [Pseudomethylobacillus aquaticus]|uniref:QacE family quaternary ammonium compound efflux SMR transporter n=1 Tax=Pseudomethylobacillus aquaticus TaxID=2676064 RepID=A0A3N0V6J2_9PROT|nr:SMR family transporter [Pseudomethylobacillus aquaticus]ROH88417.1 QacE family quaternary ammonium compound efflux SMR transporter [Pseudomethylobacillus aquaticus]
MNHWLALGIAIVAEVVATTALKSTEGFTRLWPSLVVVGGYAAAFYFMTVSLRVLPLGIMYAIWAGVGIVLVALLGWLLYKQALDLPAMLGIALIISGVVVINLFSRTVTH